MRRPLLCAAVWLWLVPPAPAQPVFPTKPPPGEVDSREVLAIFTDGILNSHDQNNDRRLNADEVPERFRPYFGAIDADHDGHVNGSDLAAWIHLKLETRPRGEVVAREVILVADDFVVEVYHNGRRVADEKRELLLDRFGASAEKVHLEVREGDWLVFNVVNNRLRWGGASYFGAAGLKEGGAPRIGFASDPASPQWSHCDDPDQVSRFIADPLHLAGERARPIETPWSDGDALMNQYADGWAGKPVWGSRRNTWIKFRVPTRSPAPHPAGPSSTIGY